MRERRPTGEAAPRPEVWPLEEVLPAPAEEDLGIDLEQPAAEEEDPDIELAVLCGRSQISIENAARYHSDHLSDVKKNPSINPIIGKIGAPDCARAERPRGVRPRGESWTRAASGRGVA